MHIVIDIVAKEQPPVEVEGKAKPVNLSKTRVIAKEPAIPVVC